MHYFIDKNILSDDRDRAYLFLKHIYDDLFGTIDRLNLVGLDWDNPSDYNSVANIFNYIDILYKNFDKKVKVIREGFYKDVYEVNGDIVEKVQRNDGSHVYYVVDAEKVIELKAGTMVIAKNGTYRVPGEIGYVLVDDREIEKPRIVRVGKFKTEDHKAEAEQLVRGRKKPQEEQE